MTRLQDATGKAQSKAEEVAGMSEGEAKGKAKAKAEELKGRAKGTAAEAEGKAEEVGSSGCCWRKACGCRNASCCLGGCLLWPGADVQHSVCTPAEVVDQRT